jgi:hypothetical protein
MAVISKNCEQCGHAIEVTVGQHVHGDRLVWHSGFKCDSCGAEVVLDDEGFPPEDMREALLAQGGEWELSVEPSGNPLSVAKVIADALSLPRTAVVRLKNALPGVVASGTLAEMDWLKRLLEKAGENAKVLRAQESTR